VGAGAQVKCELEGGAEVVGPPLPPSLPMCMCGAVATGQPRNPTCVWSLCAVNPLPWLLMPGCRRLTCPSSSFSATVVDAWAVLEAAAGWR
jgi:hypothetical protein